MTKTPLSTWPSGDLWERMAEKTLLDDTPCPVCQCPAGAHRRDVDMGAFLCPPGGDPVKLMEMVRRAPPVPNAARLATEPAFEARRQMRAAMAAEIEQRIAVNPQLRDYADEIRRIGSQYPGMAMDDVIRTARQRFVVQEETKRQLARNEERLAAALATARDLTGTVGFDASPIAYNENGIASARAAAPTKPAPPAKRKRRFNLNEDE